MILDRTHLIVAAGSKIIVGECINEDTGEIVDKTYILTKPLCVWPVDDPAVEELLPNT